MRRGCRFHAPVLHHRRRDGDVQTVLASRQVCPDSLLPRAAGVLRTGDPGARVQKGELQSHRCFLPKTLHILQYTLDVAIESLLVLFISFRIYPVRNHDYLQILSLVSKPIFLNGSLAHNNSNKKIIIFEPIARFTD